MCLPDKRGSRREFVRATLRSIFAGALTLLVAMLLRIRRQPQTCIRQGLCLACGAYQSCDLPAAIKTRRGRPAG